MAQGSMNLIGVAAIAALLSGCAAVLPSVPAAAPVAVPADRVKLAAQNGEAQITVVRDTGFAGGGCFYALYVNRQLAARIDKGETFSLGVPAGETIVGVARDPEGGGLCGTGVEGSMRVVETVMQPGQHKKFRIILAGGAAQIQRAD